MDTIEFVADRFLPYLPESSQVNPGAYGFELANWLSRELALRGIVTSYPLSEDWGWFIEHIADGVEIMIGCGSEADEGEGYRGEPIRWRVFVQEMRSLGQRLRRTAPSPRIEELVTAIRSVLRDAGVACDETS